MDPALLKLMRLQARGMVRRVLRGVSLADLEREATAALDAPSAGEVRTRFEQLRPA